MENETPEGEGLVLDWSINSGFEINLTGIPNSQGLFGIIEAYVLEHGDMCGTVEFTKLANDLI
jgi:hypothetical protein